MRVAAALQNQAEYIDHANADPKVVQRLLAGELPAIPKPDSLMWQPPQQSTPIVQSRSETGRLMLSANADSHGWQEMVPDIPKERNPIKGGATLLSYWPGFQASQYTLTLREYWALVPLTYTHVYPGGSFTKGYETSYGISTTDQLTISAELGVSVGELGAKLSAQFSHSVTTSETKSETTIYNVGAPAEGFVRVWMLWQLVDELIALGPDGKIITNPTKRGDVDWSQHGPSGAYLSYLKLDQPFPSSLFIPVQADFRAPAKS